MRCKRLDEIFCDRVRKTGNAAEARALAWGEWDGRMRRMMTEIAAGYELLAQRDRKRLCRSPIDEIQREIAVCWEVRPARSASE